MPIFMPRAEISTVIRRMGLTSGLKMNLDAGDIGSYPGSGQTWHNVGDGVNTSEDMYLGSNSTATATDPTYNGTAGRSSSDEYFSLDGGDYFSLTVANPTWVNNLHKANARFSLAGWIYIGSVAGANQGIGGTSTLLNDVGFRLNASTSNYQVLIMNGSGTSSLTITLSDAFEANSWHFLGTSIYSGGPTNSSVFMTNRARTRTTVTYSSPSAAGASYPMKLGAYGAGDFPLPSGSRIASFAFWEGVNLAEDELNALMMATRGKFGV